MSTEARSIYYQDMSCVYRRMEDKRERKTLLTGAMPRQLISLVKRFQTESIKIAKNFCLDSCRWGTVILLIQ